MLKIARPVLVAGSMLAAVAAAVPAQAAPSAEPPLRLVAGSPTVTLDRYPDFGVFLDLGTHIVAGSSPFEIRATRKSYADPIVATQNVNGRVKKLPAGLLSDFAGLPGFLHVKVTDSGGAVVLENDQTFCPNGEAARTRPDAPDTSPYPFGCSTNPFTLGSVWGVQKGWATNTVDWNSGPVDLAAGTYTAQVSVPQRYQDLFGIPAGQASATIQVTVRDMVIPPGGGRAGVGPAQAQAPQPNATRPTGMASVPKGPKPDLRALPAWWIDIMSQGGRDADGTVLRLECAAMPTATVLAKGE